MTAQMKSRYQPIRNNLDSQRPSNNQNVIQIKLDKI